MTTLRTRNKTIPAFLQSALPEFVATTLVTAVLIYVTAIVVPGFLVKNFTGSTLSALALGLLNSIFKPVLGLFGITVLAPPVAISAQLLWNAFLVWTMGKITPGVIVADWMTAFLGSLILTCAAFFVTTLISANVQPTATTTTRY